MFYKIDNKYYVLVGSNYMQVEFKIDGEEINAIPTGKSIEKTNNVKAIEQPFNDDFKKKIMNKSSDNSKDENRESSRFGR